MSTPHTSVLAGVVIKKKNNNQVFKNNDLNDCFVGESVEPESAKLGNHLAFYFEYDRGGS